MYIEEIILDGFKSYQKRTVVGKFHPKFNAITGLNGSGKSNILDSICFVLGITNLSQIRINKLEELVYKSGQAGINKASVSIIFNNEDKSSSSPLYKDLDKITVTRQIATGGRNRYLLNGSVVKPVEITNFFHSVQLNVNNSHFLIMQGRITKVVNMKPKELLSMVEEAAGTRMYETKKQQSLKLIEKKDRKLEEINRMLEEDIIPKLQRLKKERTDYLKWSSINEEIEFFERICTLHNYNRLSLDISDIEGKIGCSESALDEIEKEIAASREMIISLKNSVEEEENKLSSEWSAPLKSCKDNISDVESKVRLTQVQLNELNIDLNDEENTLADQKNQKKSIEEKLNSQVINSNLDDSKEKSEEFFKVERRINEMKEKLETNKKFLQGIRAGLDLSLCNSEQKSLRQSLYDTEKELANVSVEEKKIKMRIEEFENKIKPLNDKVKKTSISGKNKPMTPNEEYKYLSEQVKLLESEVIHLKEDAELCEKYNLEKRKIKIDNDSLEIQLQPIEMFIRTRQCIYNFGAHKELAVQAHINEVDTLLDSSKALKTKVKGSVFELIDLIDPKYTNALEMTAGGRLYNMVVENHEIGKKLLNSGLIKKRITIIPLDKILDPSISKKKIDFAKSLAKSNNIDEECVVHAVDVLKFDKELAPAIKYCFGHTIICEDENIAKMITFNPEVSTRTVTLHGDIYDPSGTLSGGSAPCNQTSILSTYKHYNEVRLKILHNNRRIEEINKALSSGLSKAADAFRHSQVQLDINKHQLKLLEERISRLKEDSLESKVEKYSNELNRLKSEYENLLNKEKCLKENKLRLENEIKVFEDTKESKEKQLEAEIERLKKEIKELSATYKNLEKITSTTRIEQRALRTELDQVLDSIVTKTNNISEIKLRIESQNSILKDLQTELNESKSSLMKLQQEIELSNETIKENKSEIKKAERLLSRKQIENSKVIHEIKTLKTDLTQKNKIKDSMARKHEWLLDQNLTNKFDLESNPYKVCMEKLEELQREKLVLSKNVNRRILNLYERVNSECNELINKRDIVIKDKDKIEDVINDLDQKKKQALENTWKTVNSSFKSIFSALLPNSTAELVPYLNPETNVESFYEGLEFKVGFGGIWKKSLSELSGGQRSLLALSLILSMLRFKPAPVYILDEIDSALDLGHTQNIGKMIKHHFPNSQFIIVSLKEGMFDKADVLFKTELIHGVSTVSRIENCPTDDECDKKLENHREIFNNCKVRRRNK